jgi:hypothetical protein
VDQVTTASSAIRYLANPMNASRAAALALLCACSSHRATPPPPASPPPTPLEAVPAPVDMPVAGQAEVELSGALTARLAGQGTGCETYPLQGISWSIAASDLAGAGTQPDWSLGASEHEGKDVTAPRVTLDLKTPGASDLAPPERYTWRPQGANDPGFRRDGQRLQLDVDVVSAKAAKVHVRATLACPHEVEVDPPPALLARVQHAAGAPARPYATFGSDEHTRGVASVLVEESKLDGVIDTLRAQLPPGWWVFQSKQYFAGEHVGHAEIAVAPGRTQFDMLRVAHSDGANYGLGTEAVIQKLQAWDAKYKLGLDIRHAELDVVEARLAHLPDDVDAFAREVYAFCPDIVDQGTETVEALAKELRAHHVLYLWWD